MRILFIIPTLGNGGTERVATSIANELSKNNEIAIVSLEKSNTEEYKLSDSVKVFKKEFDPKRGNKPAAFLSFCRFLPAMLDYSRDCILMFKPDRVISFLPKADIIAFLLRKKIGFKWVASERSDPWSRSYLSSLVLCYIYRQTDYFVCQTQKVARYYIRKGVSKVGVIRNPKPYVKSISDMEFRNKYGDYAVAVGRLSHAKNYLLMIQAFGDAILNTHSDYKLLILGDGPLRKEIEKSISINGMEDRIVLLGRHNDIFKYYSCARFFVMSSDYEGSPNALIEAMAYGLPVVSTDFRSGAASEVINDNNGILVPVGNREKLANAIEKMISLNEVERQEMGKNSSERINDFCGSFKSWKIVLEEKCK